MNMIVLPQEQIDRMKTAMDDILVHTSSTVGDIKKRNNLTGEEYDMIYDLTMPLIREINIKRFWAIKYSSLRRHITKLVESESETMDLRSEIKKLLDEKKPDEGIMWEATGFYTECFDDELEEVY